MMRHYHCPVCGRQLVNLNTEKSQKAGFHYFWCDVCDIDVTINENTTPLDSICDDDEEEDNIPWNEWLS